MCRWVATMSSAEAPLQEPVPNALHVLVPVVKHPWHVLPLFLGTATRRRINTVHWNFKQLQLLGCRYNRYNNIGKVWFSTPLSLPPSRYDLSSTRYLTQFRDFFAENWLLVSDEGLCITVDLYVWSWVERIQTPVVSVALTFVAKYGVHTRLCEQ